MFSVVYAAEQPELGVEADCIYVHTSSLVIPRSRTVPPASRHSSTNVASGRSIVSPGISFSWQLVRLVYLEIVTRSDDGLGKFVKVTQTFTLTVCTMNETSISATVSYTKYI